MLFADNPHDRQIEKLMSQIPNFKPRGHGIYIYEEKEYSAENCFCRECTYRRKKKRNSKTAPPCIEQRIRAGEVPLGEVLAKDDSELLADITAIINQLISNPWSVRANEERRSIRI